MRLVLLAAALTLISAVEWEDASQYVKPVVDFAEKSFNARMNSIFIHKITQVTKALRKAEDGWKYDMEFVMAPTDCMKFGEKHQDCHVAENSPKQTCQVDISLTSAGHFSLDDFNCKSMSKRLVGGIGAPVDNPEDDKYRNLLTRATSFTNTLYKVNKVISVRKQVVSGYKYYIDFSAANAAGKEELCTAVLWEQPWRGSLNVLDYRCDGKDYTPKNKRLAGGIGAPVDNPEDTKYKDLLRTATSSINSVYTINRVVSVRTQVVAGIKYYIDFYAANAAGKEELCKAVLWEQSWLGSLNVLNYRCDGKELAGSGKRSLAGGLVGGISSVDTSRFGEFKVKAQKAVESENADIKNIRVIDVKQQVVSGINTFMVIQGESSSGQTTTCNVRLYERSWSNVFVVESVKCT